MLSIFRTNQFIVSVLVIFYAAVLHIAAFIIADNWEPKGHGVLAELVYSWVGTKGWLPQLVTLGLLFTQTITANLIDLNFKLAKETTLFAGVFIVLMSSISLPFLRMSPVHFANAFLLIALVQIMDTFRKADCAGSIFNAGFFVGLASLFCPSYLLFTFAIFAGLNLLRSFSIRERLMVIFGVLSVYILAGTAFFWQGKLQHFIDLQFFDSFSFLDFQTGNIFTFVHLSVLGLLVIITVFLYGQFISKKTMQTQKRISMLYWGLLISIPVVMFQANIQEDHALVLAPFLGLLLGIQFSSLKPNVAELLHLFLFVAVLFFQFRPFFQPI